MGEKQRQRRFASRRKAILLWALVLGLLLYLGVLASAQLLVPVLHSSIILVTSLLATIGIYISLVLFLRDWVGLKGTKILKTLKIGLCLAYVVFFWLGLKILPPMLEMSTRYAWRIIKREFLIAIGIILTLNIVWATLDKVAGSNKT